MRIVQMFCWNLNDIASSLDMVKSQGFDAVQITPIQPLKEDNPSIWWLAYQPCGFHIGNIYGSKDDLINLCNEAHKRNIGVIADVIFDHMAGANDGSLNPNEKVDKELTNNKYFWKEKKNISDWHNRYEVTHYCMGLPGLNPNNHDLQDIIINFLNELLDCGIDGFRFDAAKNIALPEEGCDFWPRVIYSLKKYGVNLYGEIIFEDEYLFSRYEQFFKILTNDTPINKDNTIKFCESHDSYLDFGYTRNMSSDTLEKQYTDLTSTYPNTLFYIRPYDNTWEDKKIKEANYQKVLKR